MQKIKKKAVGLYKHSLFRYTFVGGSTFILDFVLLVVSKEFLHLPLALAATIAYWSSIGYNFYLNRRWTFSASESSSLSKHAVLYGSLLAFNYLFTLTFITIASDHIHYTMAKILATAISISWTYLTYKHIIFKKLS